MKPISILLLAADGGEGPLGEMIDPVLRTKFAAEGIHFQGLYVSDLQKGHLDAFHAIVLLRTPIPGHPFDDLPDFRKKSEWLREFVKKGGGLFLMFTENYGKTEESLNEFCKPWGMQFYFNQMTPDPALRKDRFPRLYESLILPFAFVKNPYLDLSMDQLGLIVKGGHGCQHLTCVCNGNGQHWRPILRGGVRIISQSYRFLASGYRNTSAEDISDPMACTAAEIEKGRVIAFPGSAPFWLINAYIWRFQGYLQEQNEGSGFQFFLAAFRWLADSERNRQLPADTIQKAEKEIDPKLLAKPRQFSFQTVGIEEQQNLQRGRSQKIWLGNAACDDLHLAKLTHFLEKAGYQAAFPLVHYRELDESHWKTFLQRGQAHSSRQLFLMPGYELLDDEGVRSAVISPESFPRHALKYPNSTLLEAVLVAISGCVSILRDPLRNRIPPQRYGGYNLIEWETGQPWFDLYQRLVASKYFISPVVFNRSEGHDSINTFVLVPRGKSAFDMMRKTRHGTYVSDGPLLENFTFVGPGLMDDEWEGYWYGYQPGDEITLTVAVSSQAPLEEIILYDGEEVFARFKPGTRSFHQQMSFPIWRDYSFHLTAVDREGQRIHATFPLYTRNLRFWGHVGSDNMNNYVSPMRPKPDGFLGVGDQLYEPFGFVTLGAAWGDYLRIAPSKEYSQLMPRQEISTILGSFNAHHPSPIIHGNGKRHHLNDHRRVFPFCGADAQAFISEIAGEHIDNDDHLVQIWHDQEIAPTRILLPAPGVKARDEYVVWRWEPDEPIYVEVRKQLSLSKPFLQDEWITFASNSHYLIPQLHVRSMRDSARCIQAEALERQSHGALLHKEWDNSHYLRMMEFLTPVVLELGSHGEVEIGVHGVGTFGLVPLGVRRKYRCMLFRSERELIVFFQCSLTGEERKLSRLVLDYLIAVDATEPKDSPFRETLLPFIDRTGGFSKTLSLNPDSTAADLDFDALFPESQGRPLYLRLTGMPPGTFCWNDHQGRMIFASQPQQGKSYHIFKPDMPRKYHGVWKPTLLTE